MVNHDAHIPKEFANYLIQIWLMDVIDLLSNFGLSSLAECYVGFPKFPGIQEIRMDTTYFLTEQLLRAEICSVDLQRGKCTEKKTVKNRMSFKPEEMHKHISLSDAAEKKLKIKNADI